jgi:DNA end-binding protein Ku
MRASWTGAISFGLVSIPVRLFRAVERHPMRLRYLHRECRTPLVTRRYCPLHERVIPWQEVVRGYEIEPDRYIVVEDQEIEQAARRGVRERRIDIEAFVDPAEIDPIYADTGYYAEPRPEGRPAYALLQQAMAQTARAAVARFALRGRERLAAIRPYDGALLVQTLHYADELRSPAGLDLPAEAAPARELRTAIRLIESMAEPFAARPLTDEYHRRLMARIEERAEAEAPVPVGPAPEREDLLTALQASIGAVDESRREAP